MGSTVGYLQEKLRLILPLRVVCVARAGAGDALPFRVPFLLHFSVTLIAADLFRAIDLLRAFVFSHGPDAVTKIVNLTHIYLQQGKQQYLDFDVGFAARSAS